MSTTKKPGPKKEEPAEGADLLHKTAVAIGSTLGALAAKTGIANPRPPSKKPGKLVAKGAKRLPRKEKKLLQKKAAKTPPAPVA